MFIRHLRERPASMSYAIPNYLNSEHKRYKGKQEMKRSQIRESGYYFLLSCKFFYRHTKGTILFKKKFESEAKAIRTQLLSVHQ